MQNTSRAHTGLSIRPDSHLTRVDHRVAVLGCCFFRLHSIIYTNSNGLALVLPMARMIFVLGAGHLNSIPGAGFLVRGHRSLVFGWFGWLCLTSHRQRGHLETAPHLLSLAKDVKLDKYTVPTGN